MAANTQRARNQHTVPKFLLRNFASGKKKQIWVFDKHTNAAFRTAVRNVAAERDFYEIETPTGNVSIEPLLAKLEAGAAPIIRTIIEQRSLAGIGEAGRNIIALYASAQMLRTKAKVEMAADLNGQLCSMLKAMGADLDKVKNFKRLSADEIREHLMLTLPATTLGLKKYFLEKAWLLQQTTESQPFYLGDNPIALHNTFNEDKPLGVAVREIEIYLPLSSTLQLCFLCSTIAHKIRLGTLLGNLLGPIDELRRLAHAIETGIPTLLQYDNVIFQNSLQVSNSSRYVYCCKPEFDLAHEMVTTDPENRYSPRMQAN